MEREITILIKWIEAHDIDEGILTAEKILGVNNKQYVLNYPLRCLFEKEDNYYVINNEQLDIIGTGMIPEDAEINFNEEFDFLYNRLNTLEDSNLSNRLIRIKGIINNIVKEVN